jgi:hypothetical protein
MPEYKGLKLKRPTRAFTDADVEEEKNRVLANDGQLVPKDGAAAKGDYVIVDMTTTFSNAKVGEAKEITLRVDDSLSFKDGVASKFGEQMVGAKAGDKRNVDISMTDAVSDPRLKGRRCRRRSKSRTSRRCGCRSSMSSIWRSTTARTPTSSTRPSASFCSAGSSTRNVNRSANRCWGS